MRLSMRHVGAASFLLLSGATLFWWNRAGAQSATESPPSKREQALRQRCIELQRHVELEGFFSRIDKVRDARKRPIEGVAEVETTDKVISMRVQGLAEFPKRQLRTGDTFRIFDRHYSIKYRVRRVDQQGVLFDFDAHMPMVGNHRNFLAGLGSGTGTVQLSYKIPYLAAKPWLKAKGH